jgi:hypothetical protein
MPQQFCPVCGHPTEPVHVHGHYQCSVCSTNIMPCCDGAQCEMPWQEADNENTVEE